MNICLRPGNVLHFVKRTDNKYDEIVRRLYAKYGRADKVTDTTLNEIKKLNGVNDGNDKRFIEMVDKIENCCSELKQLNLQKEMSTATMINKISTWYAEMGSVVMPAQDTS